ncbi:hypothetical protein C8R44DRAFT_119149 [Mycena epipterygia]|nr:hypothetical protein C8R44DRAFT_119149 [Mycena epipterygia]
MPHGLASSNSAGPYEPPLGRNFHNTSTPRTACTRHWARSAEPSTRSHVPSQSVPWSGCPGLGGTQALPRYTEGFRAVVRRTRIIMECLGAQRSPSFSALRSTCISIRLANG